MPANWEDFERLDIRMGTIVHCELFAEARRPAYKIQVDLGPLGVKRSSAQLTDLYTCEELVGRQVICVCGFAPKQIGPLMSQVLITGFRLQTGAVVLASADQDVPNGTQLV